MWARSSGRVRSWQDSLAFQSRLQRSSDLTPIDVIEHCVCRTAECVAADLERKGNLASAYELVRRSVCRNLYDLSLESAGIGHPGTHEVAVAGIRISRIRIRLLHGSVGMEHEHVDWKRCFGS